MDVVVQPAVSWMDLNEKIKSTGLFFPIDPGPSVSTRLPCFYFVDNLINSQIFHERLKSVAWLEQIAGRRRSLQLEDNLIRKVAPTQSDMEQ